MNLERPTEVPSTAYFIKSAVVRRINDFSLHERALLRWEDPNRRTIIRIFIPGRFRLNCS